MLSAEGGAGGGLAAADLPRFSRNALESVLDGEADLLARAARATRDAIVTSAPGGQCAELLRAVDYTWVHFPDEPDLASPGKSFLARVLVAIEYYAQRLERLRPALRRKDA